MEDSVKEHPSPAAAVLAKSKLRYPLRSASKSKDEKPPVAELPHSSASKRGRQASNVSKSVSVLNISGKEKSASISRPPRRLSVPARSATGKAPGMVTPISEVRAKSETPRSSASRRKFSTLCSASYWLSQIKLSESAGKHSVSLGFFKLALDAGCQPLQRMRDELKSYVGRHELDENGEIVKELLEKFNNGLGNEEQMQVSVTVSQMPEERSRSSDDDVHSSSSTVGTRNLRPRSLNTNAAKVSAVKDLSNKAAVSRTRGPVNKGSADTKSASDAGGRKVVQKKPQQPTKQGAPTPKDKASRQGKKSPTNKGPASPRDCPEENKENVVDSQTEETRLVEAI